ncbi:DUF4405 domain-containing protein [Bacillus marinisedimentorum]|uniref:DUF4405 domain-containing protein n=1 Tax=Bacillus marinisedimentorum TaxID=1821260 RepID=UPI0007E1AD81|nr:DUF4405 domain-containing protein [Bacillus marinisedimentorum]
MKKHELLQWLYRLTVPKGLAIIGVVTIPVALAFFTEPLDYNSVKWLGRIGLIYFLIAFTLYLLLFTISHSPRPKPKWLGKLVGFTRVFIRFHVATAIYAVLWILPHAWWMGSNVPFDNRYSWTGALALLALIPLLITGYMRKRKSSGKRRRFHRYSAFVFVGLMLIHFFL